MRLGALLLLATLAAGIQEKKSAEYRRAMKLIETLRREKVRPSISHGKPQDGTLIDGMRLPDEGYGYKYVHPARKRTWGTDEMVCGLLHLAAEFQERHRKHPGLRLGDISQEGGGEVSHHASHESGRDVDLIFLAVDEEGRPADNPDFRSFDEQGRRGTLRMDLARNWDLVVLLMGNPWFGKDIRYIFISKPQRKLLLAHARGLAEKKKGAARRKFEEIVERAEGLLKHWQGHDDHFHMRINLTEEDRKAGGRD